MIAIPGKNPDSIIYDPATKRVFTFNGKSKDSTVIDATSGKVIGTVKLAGKPEEAALDGKGNMLVNIEDKSSIQEFDTKSYAIKGTWPLAPCEGPSALAYDGAHQPNFRGLRQSDGRRERGQRQSGCFARRSAAIRTATATIPGTGMAVRLLPRRLRFRHSPGFGRQVHDVVGNITTQFGTRTMALDPKTHHVFTETADFKPAAAPTPDNPRPRPTPIAGSFVILEIGQ